MCGSTEAVADCLGGGHAGDHLQPEVWTTAAAGGCVRKREADAHPHRAGQDRARLVVCPETKGCSRRALVLVLTGAVHWQTRPRKRPQGLDKEHGILYESEYTSRVSCLIGVSLGSPASG